MNVRTGGLSYNLAACETERTIGRGSVDWSNRVSDHCGPVVLLVGAGETLGEVNCGGGADFGRAGCIWVCGCWACTVAGSVDKVKLKGTRACSAGTFNEALDSRCVVAAEGVRRVRILAIFVSEGVVEGARRCAGFERCRIDSCGTITVPDREAIAGLCGGRNGKQ